MSPRRRAICALYVTAAVMLIAGALTGAITGSGWWALACVPAAILAGIDAVLTVRRLWPS